MLIGDPLVDGRELRERLLAAHRDLPVLSALMLALAPAVEQIEADRDLWRLRLKVIHHNPALLPALHARGAAAEAAFVAAIAARARVATDHLYPLVTASVLGAAFRTALLRWAVAESGPELLELVGEAVGMVADGLQDPEPTTEEDR